jgi:hypothetical protein
MTYLGICCTCKRVEECGMNGAVSECERFEAGKFVAVEIPVNYALDREIDEHFGKKEGRAISSCRNPVAKL